MTSVHLYQAEKKDFQNIYDLLVEFKEVDLNDLAGQSSVYLWFFGKTGPQFRSDICIDDVEVVGEE